jgi:hypothetical protein
MDKGGVVNFHKINSLKLILAERFEPGRALRRAIGVGAGFSTVARAFSSFRINVRGRGDDWRSRPWVLSFGGTDLSGGLYAVSIR